MAAGMIFHTRARDSFLNSCSPLSKLLLLLTWCIIVTVAPWQLVYALSAILLVFAIAQRLPLDSWLSQGLLFAILAIFILVTERLATGSLILAAASALSFLSSILASLIFIDSTSPDELATSLSWLLAPILGKKAYLLSSAIQLTLSMIPMIFDTAQTIREARKARGARFLAHPVRSVTGYATQLVMSLLDNVSAWSDALSARSYTPYAVRGTVSFSWRDAMLVLSSLALIGLWLWTRLV